jgi:hypothetical protein
MEYLKIYNQIIERAKTRQLEGYKEIHHILPKCLGGLNIKENLVELTAREHFLCHMLLCEIYPKENKLKHALFLMSIGKQKIKENQYVIGSRVYERLKTEYSQFLTGKSQTQKTKDKKSKSMLKIWDDKTKNERSLIGLKTWETRRINGNGNLTPEHKEKIKNALKGKDNTKANNSRKKIILQYDLKNNFIKEWSSQAEIYRQLKINQSDISSCCREKQKTAGGFIWKFKK